MSAKTIFIIIISVLVTIVLMKNTDEVRFWIFGDAYVPKLAILGTMFGLGVIVGFLLGRPRKKTSPVVDHAQTTYPKKENNNLSDEDRDYIH